MRGFENCLCGTTIDSAISYLLVQAKMEYFVDLVGFIFGQRSCRKDFKYQQACGEYVATHITNEGIGVPDFRWQVAGGRNYSSFQPNGRPVG